MADVLVLGAGLGGLTTAMVLARDGHQVTVLERDPGGPPPERADAAWDGWQRRGVNQFLDAVSTPPGSCAVDNSHDL